MIKICVCCPGNAVTGGPELLHQLVAEMRRQGQNAYIVYYPFNEKYLTPKQYLEYNCPIGKINDSVDSYVIVPETLTCIIDELPISRKAIWWLSVDNYLRRKEGGIISRTRNILSFLKNVRLSRQQLKALDHFAQSHYAKEFLEKKGIAAQMLSDYLTRDHGELKGGIVERNDIILYNPKKGYETTKKIIAACRHLEFRPIEKMSALEVRNQFSKAKLYVDFGLHPGKDRMPREAAINGCCVITGVRGSAGNMYDVPIPAEYKINQQKFGFERKFRNMAHSVLDDFELHSKRFHPFRRGIAMQYEIFQREVSDVCRLINGQTPR